MIEAILITIFTIIAIGTTYAAWKILTEIKIDPEKAKLKSVEVSRRTKDVSIHTARELFIIGTTLFNLTYDFCLNLIEGVGRFIKERQVKKEVESKVYNDKHFHGYTDYAGQISPSGTTTTSTVEVSGSTLRTEDGITWRGKGVPPELEDKKEFLNQFRAMRVAQLDNIDEEIKFDTRPDARLFQEDWEAMAIKEAEIQREQSMQTMQKNMKAAGDMVRKQKAEYANKTEKGLDEIFLKKM